jgi:hypothetical protein
VPVIAQGVMEATQQLPDQDAIALQGAEAELQVMKQQQLQAHAGMAAAAAAAAATARDVKGTLCPATHSCKAPGHVTGTSSVFEMCDVCGVMLGDAWLFCIYIDVCCLVWCVSLGIWAESGVGVHYVGQH